LEPHILQAAPQPAASLRDRRSAIPLALVIAAAHAVNDAYASFIPPLLPRIMDELGLSIALAATLAVAFSIAASLPQPLFGYLADRYGRRIFAVLGPVLSAVFVSTIGRTGSGR
jgi:FSR family fosmidomycin resistance protein-like MFS transporter